MSRQRCLCLSLLVAAVLLSAGWAGGEEVYFADPNLELAVRQRLSVFEPTPITDSSMLNLRYFIDYLFMDITDLAGLEYALNLEYLRLDNTRITDLSPLSGLGGNRS